MDAGGYMHHDDLETYEWSLRHVAKLFWSSLKILEIGSWSGHTSRSARKVLLDTDAKDYEHWIVDNMVEPRGVWEPPFPGCNCVWGDSADVSERTPNDLGLLMIDGCHCYHHVLSDWRLYAPKVLPGGLILVHDFNEKSQGTQYQYHGDMHSVDSHISVRRALHDLGVTRGHKEWDVAKVGGDGGTWWGQFIVFRKSCATQI